MLVTVMRIGEIPFCFNFRLESGGSDALCHEKRSLEVIGASDVQYDSNKTEAQL